MSQERIPAYDKTAACLVRISIIESGNNNNNNNNPLLYVS